VFYKNSLLPEIAGCSFYLAVVATVCVIAIDRYVTTSACLSSSRKPDETEDFPGKGMSYHATS